MPYANISITVPQADVDAVKAAIATLNAKLPFLIALENEERQALTKLGPKSVDFVIEAKKAAADFPDILPARFDQAEYAKDAALFEILGHIHGKIASFYEKLDDTYMAVGSETMLASLEVYAHVRTSEDKTPGLKSVAERLRERFKGQGNRKKKS